MAVYTGKILKGIGGFYYVKTDLGVIESKACGKFRKTSDMPYVGDNVDLEINNENKGYITHIHKRQNVFVRPPVSNIDNLIIVASLYNPAPDLLFVDKLAAIAASNNVRVSVCFNKCDLLSDAEIKSYTDIYEKSGYNVYVTSTKTGAEIDFLASEIKGTVTAFSGFSGVGKSSLINRIIGYNQFDVGEISKKLSRGKHTTRHVEFIGYETDSYIVDTPGFSVLSLSDAITKDNLKNYFAEFKDYEAECKFSDCLHVSDGVCAVCSAVKAKKIPESRYTSYKTLLDLLKEKKEWNK